MIIADTMNEIRGGLIMKNILRGIGILAAIAAVFMLMTACAPNKAMTRSNDGAASHGFDKKSDYTSDDKTYMDSEEFSVDNKDVEQPATVKAKPRKAVVPEADESEEPVTVKSSKRAQPESDDNISGGEGDRYYQTGIASWYGREFQGKKTASGEKFDMNELTAAHRTLPLGSVITVKNLDNGKLVKVRVNDRGPFKGKRILDLSFAAAKKLNMVGDGEAMVGIKVLGAGSQDYSSKDSVDDNSEVSGAEEADDTSLRSRKHPSASSRSAESANFALQTGAFYSKRNAEKLKSRLSEIFPDNDVTVYRDGDMYKVRVLNITSRKDADRFKKTLAGDEIKCFIVEQN